MKILHLSDTHDMHHRLRDLPKADILVHSGDFCMVGNEQEALDFLNWFCDLPYKHKIFICGNHDDYLYNANIDGLPDNVHHLRHSSITIDGIKFYGVPMFMSDTTEGRHGYHRIPNDVDVLVTHCPPHGILDFDDDFNYGSKSLRTKIDSLHQLKAHLFGHIHARHDTLLQGSAIFSNGAIMDADYTHLNTPNLIQL